MSYIQYGVVGFISGGEKYLRPNDIGSEPDMLGADILDYIININHSEGWEFLKTNLNCIISVPGNFPLNGIEWMEEIYFNELSEYNFDNGFIKDSLYCDYGYIINLDTMCFEMYIGNQKEPQDNNTFGTNNINGYYPCKLVAIIQIHDIIETSFESIVKHIKTFESEQYDIEIKLPKRKKMDLNFNFKL